MPIIPELLFTRH